MSVLVVFTLPSPPLPPPSPPPTPPTIPALATLCQRRIARGAVPILRIGFVESLSRWHGIAAGTTVGGDVDAVTTADTGTVTITVDTATAIVSTAITQPRRRLSGR